MTIDICMHNYIILCHSHGSIIFIVFLCIIIQHYCINANLVCMHEKHSNDDEGRYKTCVVFKKYQTQKSNQLMEYKMGKWHGHYKIK